LPNIDRATPKRARARHPGGLAGRRPADLPVRRRGRTAAHIRVHSWPGTPPLSTPKSQTDLTSYWRT